MEDRVGVGALRRRKDLLHAGAIRLLGPGILGHAGEHVRSAPAAEGIALDDAVIFGIVETGVELFAELAITGGRDRIAAVIAWGAVLRRALVAGRARGMRRRFGGGFGGSRFVQQGRELAAEQSSLAQALRIVGTGGLASRETRLRSRPDQVTEQRRRERQCAHECGLASSGKGHQRSSGVDLSVGR